MVGVAIALTNLSEALSIGELIRQEQNGGGNVVWRVLGWTGLIAASLLVSALGGWFFLRGLPQPILAALTAVGAGAMLYLTATVLVPEGAERQYQQSAALATGAGFLTIMILSHLV